jgi:hypothetical protein
LATPTRRPLKGDNRSRKPATSENMASCSDIAVLANGKKSQHPIMATYRGRHNLVHAQLPTLLLKVSANLRYYGIRRRIPQRTSSENVYSIDGYTQFAEASLLTPNP